MSRARGGKSRQIGSCSLDVSRRLTTDHRPLTVQGRLEAGPTGPYNCRFVRCEPGSSFAVLSARSKHVASGKFLFTSESVSMGHPDKLADQISDGVLDALLAQDPNSRVACETLVTTDFCLLAGEITSKAKVDYAQVARDVIKAVGYTHDDIGFNDKTCNVVVKLHSQSPDIAMGVDRDGAGDQGLMFGYACDETPEMMPLPIALSHRILNRLTRVRQQGEVDWLRPDSKSQVTVEYDGDKAVRIDSVVVSTQHSPKITQAQIRDYVIKNIIAPELPRELVSGEIKYHINPDRKSVV